MMFHSSANGVAVPLMKLLFASVACVRVFRPRKCESSLRTFAGGQSHQPFLTVYHFIAGSTQDRLDGHGEILSRSATGIPFASR